MRQFKASTRHFFSAKTSDRDDETFRTGRRYPLAAVETEYSLWSREVEDEVLPVLRELGGIGFVCRFDASRIEG
ncbi:hypothetical protein [Paenibacillus sanfengchensis]|uniref:hypothetical protein n=1 Tax=Paenibacillus sanfengchensis TaxID=3119819 RepID=UPI003A5BD20C